MYKIIKISPSGNGERLLVSLLSPDGESESYSISCDGYRELGLKKGEISGEIYEKLIDLADYEAALLKGMRILGFGANSPKQLEEKMRRSGIFKDKAREAVAELCRRGYINEKNDAYRLAEAMFRKNYGLKKIIAGLRVKGYSQDTVEFVLSKLSKFDFEASCVEIARKKLKNLSDDRASIQKAIAKLVGLGYNVSEAKFAVVTVLQEQKESCK